MESNTKIIQKKVTSERPQTSIPRAMQNKEYNKDNLPEIEEIFEKEKEKFERYSELTTHL